MILTTCAACAAPLAHDAPRCVRCWTRYCDSTSLDDLHEAVTTLEETERTARRVMGGTHPLTMGIEGALREAWALLRAHETPPAGDK